MCRVQTNEKIEQFINMYIFCDVSLLPNPLQNAQQHQHTRTCNKKNMLFVNFITHYLPCVNFLKKTILNKWKSSIFTTIPPNKSKKKNSIFKRFLKK
jgi:hypothetical protein